MSLSCPSPLWENNGYVSDCVIYTYIRVLIPFAAGLISAITCCIKYGCDCYSWRISSKDRRYCSSNERVITKKFVVEYVTVLCPLFQRLEIIGLVANIVLCVLFLDSGKAHDLSSICAAAGSIYLCALALLRWTYKNDIGIHLQLHSVWLYTVQWMCLATEALGKKPKNEAVVATAIRLLLFVTLWMFHVTAPRYLADKSNRKITLGQVESASLLSRISFWWINELLWKAFRSKSLQPSDLYPLDQCQKVETIALIIHDYFSSNPNSSLLWCLFRVFTYDLLEQGAFAAIASVAVFIPPFLIQSILEHIESSQRTVQPTVWVFVAFLLISGIVAGIANCQCSWLGHRLGAKVRAILIDKIYSKTLRKKVARTDSPENNDDKDNMTSEGNILNLLSVDTDHVSEMSGNLYLVWVTFPLQTMIGTWMLYRLLGSSGIIGVLIMITLLPVNFWISQHTMAVQAQLLQASDSRIQASNETLKKIRTIKYSGWEKLFTGRVMDKRQMEIRELRRRLIWWSITQTTFHSLPFIITAVTCFCYTVVFRDNKLTTTIAFPALTIFGLLRIPLDRMAASVTFLTQSYLSLGRIDNFLREPETEKYDQLLFKSNPTGIGFSNATFSWPASAVSSNSTFVDDDNTDNIFMSDLPFRSDRGFRLEDINIKFIEDALNIVLGPSGSGKSSLLLGLLGEMHLVVGEILLPHDRRSGRSINMASETTAYCPQEPWILNRSVRENIVLNLPFDGSRYETVLREVALLVDLAALDKGDRTMAGEGGSKLSGGQRQRVALARALYSPSKYVLLDDSLSALDSSTARHIFFHAIKGPLMAGRTCIFATHNTQLVIPNCDYVVVLENGRVETQGTSKEMALKGILEKKHPRMRQNSTSANVNSLELIDAQSSSCDLSPGLFHDSISLNEVSNSKDPESTPLYAEDKAEGAVAWPVIRAYLLSMGQPFFWVVVLSVFGAQQIAALGTNLWIKEWAFQYDKNIDLRQDSITLTHIESSPEEYNQKVDSWYYMAIYIAICGSYIIISVIRDVVTLKGSLRASKEMYEKLLTSIVYARLVFFDRVPFGQIQNRFTKDVEVMDQLLAGFSASALQLIASIIMVLLLICFIQPVFLVIAIFTVISYYLVTTVYINAARDLKRIESVQRSPLFQQLEETLSGFVSIRAYSHTEFFSFQNRKLIDQLNQPFLFQWATQAWLTLRVDVLSSCVSFFTGFFILWNLKSIDPGSAGLVLAYSATFSENVMWFVQIYSIIQQNLSSIERIVEFTKVEQEGRFHSKPRELIYDLPQNWPSRTKVEFKSYSTRYSPEMELALDDISFELRQGERVAIVGRSGAGKSTLGLALIRGVEAASGRIDLDGIDISTVPLHYLRQLISLVPQNPELFDGTIRYNMDPLHQHSDEEIYKMLDTVRLGGRAYDQCHLLDQAANILSRGQRQLLCLARALLCRSRLIVLDEVTASLDYETDVEVQAALRHTSIAHGITVLTIAHRLLSIADYDKVVVLDTGRVMEQGSVNELLSPRDSDATFRHLCEESGDLDKIKTAATRNM